MFFISCHDNDDDDDDDDDEHNTRANSRGLLETCAIAYVDVTHALLRMTF